MKSKVVCEQLSVLTGIQKYKILSLTNRTTPKIGEILTEEQVKTLFSDDVTVEIKQSKNSR